MRPNGNPTLMKPPMDRTGRCGANTGVPLPLSPNCKLDAPSFDDPAHNAGSASVPQTFNSPAVSLKFESRLPTKYHRRSDPPQNFVITVTYRVGSCNSPVQPARFEVVCAPCGKAFWNTFGSGHTRMSVLLHSGISVDRTSTRRLPSTPLKINCAGATPAALSSCHCRTSRACSSGRPESAPCFSPYPS